MDKIIILNEEQIWEDFAQRHKLSGTQISQFKKYSSLLQTTNEHINLTAITKLQDIIFYHFDDSLAIDKLFNFNDLNIIADVGTGAGFPALPLKIIYPHLKIILIEVNQKKIEFLKKVAQELELKGLEYVSIDWRTFLRSTEYTIELFCSRASLQPVELVRAFSLTSAYKSSIICYWAAKNWVAEDRIINYVVKDYAYKVGDKERRLIIFNS